tara:strand:- start:597 stop:779 length:183 start_codon:yes stop_codon:yes gene_type:complete
MLNLKEVKKDLRALGSNLIAIGILGMLLKSDTTLFSEGFIVFVLGVAFWLFGLWDSRQSE